MSEHADFLVEVGTEELPPKSLSMLSTIFQREIEKGLKTHQLAHAKASRYASPRRLAVKVQSLALRQEDQHVERRGPAVSAAFDANDEPTKAALGFAASCQSDVASLGRVTTDKGEFLSFSADIAGRPSEELLPAIVTDALAALPIPKPMRWGSGTAEFVRPVHWVVMLLGKRTVEATVLGVASANVTRGHRFHHPAELVLTSADDYPEILGREAHVIAAFDQRREVIAKIARQAAEDNDATAIIDPALLDEVTALVEWPVAVVGSFDAHFLELPREVLIASMQDHQKYFPLESDSGELTNKFITISNIESRDPAAVRYGNERVIRPRLSDAAFFWDQDRKTTLEQRLERLDAIVFERRLGSIGDKTKRVVQLARVLAPNFGADAQACARAALLSRCDLVTEMVGEFPELQGLMGSYYARQDGEDETVATAIGEFYRPRFAGDAIARSEVGRCVSFADKIDTLIGIFAIGSAPSGDKDPYALRRAALGCIRIALESNSPVSFDDALAQAGDGYANVVDTEDAVAAVRKFLVDRMRSYFADQKIPGSVVEAVLAVRPDTAGDLRHRIDGVAAFQSLPEASALAAANKRIANLLRKSATPGDAAVNRKLLADPEEIELADRLNAIRDAAEQHFENARYADYLSVLAGLHDPINAFFDNVMVMCEDPRLRENRLLLLGEIHDCFTRVADISRLND